MRNCVDNIELPIQQTPSELDNSLYNLYKAGNAEWNLICIFPNKERTVIRVHAGSILAVRSKFFYTILYGDHADKFAVDEPNSTVLNITNAQFQVLSNIIIPYLYNQNVSIKYDEEFIHAFSFAKYFEISNLIDLLKMHKCHFLKFGMLYKICCLYTDQFTGITAKPEDFFASDGVDVTMINSAASKLSELFAENGIHLLEFPAEVIGKLINPSNVEHMQNFFLFSFNYAEYIWSGNHPFHEMYYTLPNSFWEKFTTPKLKDLSSQLILKYNLQYPTVLKISKLLSTIPNVLAIFLVKYIGSLIQSNALEADQFKALVQCIEFEKIDQRTFTVLCNQLPFASKEMTFHFLSTLINTTGVKFPTTTAPQLSVLFDKIQTSFPAENYNWYDFLLEYSLKVIPPLLLLHNKTKNEAALFLLDYFDKKKAILQAEERHAYGTLWEQFDCSELPVDTLSCIAKRLEIPVITKNKIIDILAQKVPRTRNSNMARLLRLVYDSGEIFFYSVVAKPYIFTPTKLLFRLMGNAFGRPSK